MYLRLEMGTVLGAPVHHAVGPHTSGAERVVGSQSSHYDDCTPAWWLHQVQPQLSPSPSREASSSGLAKGRETFSRSWKYHISSFSIFWFEEERTAYMCQVSACLLRYHQTCTLACPSQSALCLMPGREGTACRQRCAQVLWPHCASLEVRERVMLVHTRSLSRVSVSAYIQFYLFIYLFFPLEFMGNVTVVKVWELHSPVLPIDHDIRIKGVMWASTSSTTVFWKGWGW